MFIKNLGNGFEIREVEENEFWALWEKHSPTVFDESLDFFWREHISEKEKEHLKSLRKNMGTPATLRLGVFKGTEFVGWSFGDQQSADTYYMRNSGVLKKFRKQGLYTSLLTTTIEILKERGFQKIYSRHNATNNAVIIPKLKAGFIITAMEIDDMFGTLVHLSYYTNPLRRKMMDFRSGQLRPDEEMKRVLSESER